MFSLGIMIGGVRSKSPAFAKVITQKGKRSGRDGQGKSTTLPQKAAPEWKSIEHARGRGHESRSPPRRKERNRKWPCECRRRKIGARRSARIEKKGGVHFMSLLPMIAYYPSPELFA